MADMTLVQVRLPELEAEELRQAGKAATPARSLPAEIIHRLHAYQTGDGVSRALGDLMVMIADDASISEVLPPLPGANLAVVKLAMGQVLDALGAAAKPDDEVNSLAKLTAARLIRYLKSPEPLPRQPAEIDRIRKALAAGLATETTTKKQPKTEKKA